MCIRDSLWYSEVGEAQDWWGLTTLGWVPPRMSPGPRGPRPVSYTHLRAHETVLDLVCRLLLEKKKTCVLTRVIAYQTININITQCATMRV